MSMHPRTIGVEHVSVRVLLILEVSVLHRPSQFFFNTHQKGNAMIL